MEGNKLEISGKDAEGGDQHNATYKPIPEADVEGRYKIASCMCLFFFIFYKRKLVSDVPLSRPKNLNTPKITTPELDGADEKMLPNEEKKIAPNSNIDVGNIKFTSNDKQNGDAKLDIGMFHQFLFV